MAIISPRHILLILAVRTITAYCVPLAQENVPTGQPTPNATINEKEIIRSWVAEPRRRGTLGIIMSCVLTLFLCVWTTVQVNIEPVVVVSPNVAPPGWKWLATVDNLLAKRWMRKIGWSITSLMIPEATMTIAAFERCTARLLRIEMLRLFPKTKKGKGEVPSPWDDLSLSYYAVMGGFRVNFRRPDGGTPPPRYPPPINTVSGTLEERPHDGSIMEAETPPGGLTASGPGGGPTGSKKAAPDGGHGEQEPTTSAIAATETSAQQRESSEIDENVGILTGMVSGRHKAASYDWDNLKTPVGTLTPHGVLWMAHKGWLPEVQPEAIKDKSKVNALAKVLVVFQAGWMIIQAIARAAAGQHVTLIELHTVLHAICAATMYITWWDKPVDIELPTEIYLTREQFEALSKACKDEMERNPTNPFSRGNLDKNAHRQPGAPPEFGSKDKKYVTSRAGLGKIMYQQLSGETNIFGDFQNLGNAFGRIIDGRTNLVEEGTFLCMVGLVYGGAHLATWDNHFETTVERRMWQASSIIAAVAVLGFVLQLCIGALIRYIEFGADDSESDDEGEDQNKNTQMPTTQNCPPDVEKTANPRGNDEITEADGAAAAVEIGEKASSSTHVKPAGGTKRKERKPRRRRDRFFWRLYKGFVGFTVGFGFIIVIVARLFLLVESFIALRGLPAGAYDSVAWVEAWPHVG